MLIRKSIENFDPDEICATSKSRFFLEFSPSISGEELGLPVMLIKGRAPGKTLAAVAGIHGDEYEGVQAIHEVFNLLDAHDVSGNVLLVPVANLRAHRNCSRISPDDHLNLARVFPGRREGTITERIAFHLSEQIIGRADFFVDLHSGGINYVMPPLVGYDMNDSDAGKVSQEAARIFGVSTIWGHPGEPPPGRTISEAHSRAIPWLYVESSGGGRIRTDELQYYTSGLLNLLRFLQIINGIPARQPIKFHLIGNGDIDSAVTAKTAGFFTPTVGILDYVLPGHRVGLVRDMFGDTIEEIVAPNEGNVVLLRALPIVRPGDTLCVITGGSGIDTY